MVNGHILLEQGRVEGMGKVRLWLFPWPTTKVHCLQILVYQIVRRKEMFYLTTHSTHFILRLYGVGYMVKDHSVSERGNPLPPHGLLFPINSNFFLYAPSHRQDSTYHGLCYTSRGALAGTRNKIVIGLVIKWCFIWLINSCDLIWFEVVFD